ncbi:hypothetical protein QUB16_05280 [Microcoleus sp. D3_18a_C4]
MSLFLIGGAIEWIYASLQKMVTFSHRQGDRGNLYKFTKDGYFFSPAGRSKRFIL